MLSLAEMAAAVIFSALFNALMSWSRLPYCSTVQMTGWLLLQWLLCHCCGSSHCYQLFHIVYVVNVAKQNELSISSRPYVPYNCCTIGSVNCIPIGHLLGQQQHYRNTDSQWSHMTHKVCSSTSALNSSPLDVQLQLNIYIYIWIVMQGLQYEKYQDLVVSSDKKKPHCKQINTC